MKKHIITEREYEGITYKVLSEKEIKEKFEQWQNQLDKNKKRQFEKYRNCLWTKRNLNEKLREGKKCVQAEIMSKAISKVEFEDDIIVYRRIAKQEKNDIQEQLKNGDGKMLYFKDFKGTHVGKEIIARKCSGYIIFLIPAKSPVSYINNLSKIFRKEKELLIDKGQEYILIGKENIFKDTKYEREAYIVKLNLTHA